MVELAHPMDCHTTFICAVGSEMSIHSIESWCYSFQVLAQSPSDDPSDDASVILGVFNN